MWLLPRKLTILQRQLTALLAFALGVFPLAILGQGSNERYQRSQRQIDSLKVVIQESASSGTKVNALKQITQLYFTGVYQLDSAKKYADALYGLSQTQGDERGMALGRYYQGRVADGKGDFATAIGLLNQYLASDVVKGDSGLLANGLYNLGSVYIHQGDLEKALEYQLRVLRLDEASGNATNIGLSLNNLGIIMKELGREDEAIEYLEKTRFIFDSLGDQSNVALALSNLGGLYSKQGEEQRALEAFEQSLQIYQQFQHQRGIAVALEHIATIEGRQGLFDQALRKHHQSLQIKKQVELNKEIAESYHYLGVLHQEAGNLDSADHYFNESLNQAKDVADKKSLRRAYRRLSELAALKGNYQAAYENYRSYHSTSDSILNESSAAQISRLETQYQVEKKEAEIDNLRSQQLLNDRLRYALQWALIATAFLGLAAVAFFFYRARVNRNLLKAERELDQMKTRFFANISHEFRTPLTLILGPLRQLQRGDFQGDMQSMYGVMIRNAQRLLTLINQLLDLSKLEEGKVALQAEEGDLVRFCRLLVTNYTSLADSKHIKYTFFTKEEELLVWFDSDKLEIVLQNLVSNALKFTADGGEVVVFLGRHHEGGKDWVEIVVKDSGMGIKKEELAFVFDRFYQTTNNQKDGGEGTGIGLSLTKELVELHHGKISVTSEEGKGSSFKVLIPHGPKHLSAAEKMVKSTGKLAPREIHPEEELMNIGISPETATTDPGLPTILVVEDNPDMREFIALALQQHFNILTAQDGEEGYQMATDKDPDLIVSDVMMPKMDGTEMCQQLKTDAKTSHIPVVLLTAKADRTSKLHGLEIGADDYLAKPFDDEELRLIIRNRIIQRQKLKEQFKASPANIQLKELGMTSADEKFLQQAIDIVEQNLSDPNFQVENLCREIGFSQRHLHRKLTALTDLGPNQFIRHVRLKRAADRIQNKTDKISQIAFEVGFNNMSYFNKCFKEQFGMTPGEYALQPISS